MDRSLRQTMGEPGKLFEAVSIILTGGRGQLLPVGGRPLQKLEPNDQHNLESFQAYRLFVDIVFLDKMQRQVAVGDDTDQ